jgi:iron complex outermembrane recepter protein
LVQALPGSAFQNFANTNTPGSSYPTWKANTTFGYRGQAINIGMRWRYQSKIRDVSAILTPSNVAIGVPTYSLYDLFGSYNLNKNITFRAGVNNLFNKQPPIVASSQNSSDPSVFDPVGRSWFIGVKLNY